mgnify:CR=1 FL=1
MDVRRDAVPVVAVLWYKPMQLQHYGKWQDIDCVASEPLPLQRRMWHSPRFWVAIALLAGLALFLLTPLHQLLDRAYFAELLRNSGHWAIALFVLTYTILTVLGIPGTMLTVAGGAAFGVVQGTLWSVVGATFGAIGAFWVARYLLRGWAKRQFGRHKRLKQFDRAVRRYPWQFVFAVRFAPISPFNVVNFLFGLTPIHWIPYSVGTFFGIMPGTLLYTWLGVTGRAALQGGDRLPFFLALGFLVVLSLLPLCVRGRWIWDRY